MSTLSSVPHKVISKTASNAAFHTSATGLNCPGPAERSALNTYLRLPDLLLAITLLLGISAMVIPLARRLGIGPELGLLCYLA